MLKSAAYLFLLITAGTFVVLTTMTVPHLFAEEQRDDLRNDLARAWGSTVAQYRLMAYEQLVAAQSTATDKKLVSLFEKAQAATRGDDEGEEEDFAEPPPDAIPSAGKAEAISAELARTYRQDLIVILTREGKVLASSHESGPKRDEDLSGLPPVKDALSGIRRDWIWTRSNDVLLTATSPIVLARGDKQTIAGIALVGERMDSSMASDLASRIEPVRSANSHLDIAFIHKGNKLGSSVKDAEIQNLINIAASGHTDTALPHVGADEGLGNQRNTEVSGNQIVYLISGLQKGPEGDQVGVVLLINRSLADRNIVDMAAAAYAIDLPPEINALTLVVFAVALALFLFGLLLISVEIAAPGRKLVTELSRIENHIEEGEIKVKRFRGTYFRATKQVNTILTGLRKRLERERAAVQENLISPDAIEPISEPLPPLRAPSDPAVIQSNEPPAGLPFSGNSSPDIPPRRDSGSTKMPTGQFDLIEKSAPKRVELEEGIEPPSSPFLTRDSSLDDQPAVRDEEEEEIVHEAVLEAIEPEPEPEPVEDDSPLELSDSDALSQDFADALSQDLAEAISQDLANTATEDAAAALSDNQVAAWIQPDEDATVDIGPAQLQNLISQNNISSPGVKSDDLDEGLDTPSESKNPTRPVEYTTDLRRGEEQATVVDSLGVMKHLANNLEEEEQDMLEGSAIAAAITPEDGDNHTEEVSRDDEGFIAALEASSQASHKPSDLDPQGLLNALKARNKPRAGDIPAPQAFVSEHSAVRPFPSEIQPMPRKNPFLHQAPTTPGAPPTKAPENIDPDQQYFEKLYDQFVKTKKQCGEPTEGLTMKKFVKRLHRNKSTLMERYNCRSVRFQVYVKGGKAALKATPIK